MKRRADGTGELPTVRVQDPSRPADFIVINETDFDPAVHVLYTEPVSPPKSDEE